MGPQHLGHRSSWSCRREEASANQGIQPPVRRVHSKLGPPWYTCSLHGVPVLRCVVPRDDACPPCHRPFTFVINRLQQILRRLSCWVCPFPGRVGSSSTFGESSGWGRCRGSGILTALAVPGLGAPVTEGRCAWRPLLVRHGQGRTGLESHRCFSKPWSPIKHLHQL